MSHLDGYEEAEAAAVIGVCRSTAMFHREETVRLREDWLEIFPSVVSPLPCAEGSLLRIFLS